MRPGLYAGSLGWCLRLSMHGPGGFRQSDRAVGRRGQEDRPRDRVDLDRTVGPEPQRGAQVPSGGALGPRKVARLPQRGVVLLRCGEPVRSQKIQMTPHDARLQSHRAPLQRHSAQVTRHNAQVQRHKFVLHRPREAGPPPSAVVPEFWEAVRGPAVPVPRVPSGGRRVASPGPRAKAPILCVAVSVHCVIAAVLCVASQVECVASGPPPPVAAQTRVDSGVAMQHEGVLQHKVGLPGRCVPSHPAY